MFNFHKLLFSFILSIGIFVFPLTKPANAATGDDYYVTVDSLNVRSGPSTSHSVVSNLQEGARLTEHDREGAWVRISDTESSPLWVFAEHVSRQKPVDTKGSVVSDSLSVESQKLDNNRVLLELTTSIPGTIEVVASISLSGQAPDDTWIGEDERVQLINGNGQVIIDVSNLPAGEYDVEATFYPRWGFQDEESKSSGVDEPLEYKHTISLTGSGESAELAAQRNENQRWVMENAVTGKEWNPDFWRSRFGNWEEFPVTTRNPEIISNYYFESLDMTLVVNTLKDEIVVWRMGRDGL